MHGPSARTVLVRRLTRKRLRKIEPWTEESFEAPPNGDPTPSQAAFRGADALDPHDADWDQQCDEGAWREHLEQFEAPDGMGFDFCDSRPEAPAAQPWTSPTPPSEQPRAGTLSANATRDCHDDLCELDAIFGSRGQKRKRRIAPPAVRLPPSAELLASQELDPDILEL